MQVNAPIIFNFVFEVVLNREGIGSQDAAELEPDTWLELVIEQLLV